ncbi:MAG: ribonuclease HII [Candidatus Cloacimonetes bacterium]|nr:ribonuclease HII [Candidatus Cloacimonadota bacterium]
MSLLYEHDLALRLGSLIGVDEAGRGALAGPVVIAAVKLDLASPIEGINDSKKLSPAKREHIFEEIISRAISWHIVEIDNEWIDAHNILQATLKGMREAAQKLANPGDHCLIDGNQIPHGMPCPATALIGGDSLSANIAAASILAKVHRDRLMIKLDETLPQYGFARHKGYPTAAHLSSLAAHGPSALHRKSFSPVSAIKS